MTSIRETHAERRQRAKRTPAQAKAAAQSLRDDYRITFGTEQGQRVLADICRRCAVMQTSFVAGQSDVTAYQEGRRRVALEIIEAINPSPEASDELAITGETKGIYE